MSSFIGGKSLGAFGQNDFSTVLKVLNMRKKSNIHIWKEKIQKNVQLSFW